MRVQSQDAPPVSPSSRLEAGSANSRVVPTLREGSLRFSSVLIQGVTHIAPAVGLVLSIQYIVQLAGAAAPMAFFVAFLIILMLGISLTQLARHHPSAGGYYTYIHRTIHHRAGFLIAWVYFLYDPAATAVNLAFMGYFLQGTLRAELGFIFPCGSSLYRPRPLLRCSFIAESSYPRPR